MEHTKPKATPMRTNEKLHRDSEGVGADQHLHRSMIGSLLYLTTSRPDLCFSVGVCARYQANPKESHLQAVKRILRYVHGTTQLGIFYSNSSTVALAGYSDADWAGNSDDRKSTSGGCFYLGTNLVAWYSKKQNSISLSTAEAEYIAAGSCCTQLLWMKQMLADYGFEQDTLTVFCDNTSAIDISKNPVQHSHTKHIDIRYHFIRELKSFPRSQKVPEEELKSTEYEQQVSSSANTSASYSTDSEEVRTLNSSELDDIPISQLRRKPQQPSKPTSSRKHRRISEPSAPIESRSIGIASRLRPRTSKEAVSTPQRTPVLHSTKRRTASASASAPVQEVPNVN
ncbi:hypothetical protein H6P81_018412 [Aristolochia fimbriata]|uniref:Gag-pol polyprotein n=1 Tax=Aristolochia fimbriata TaxID=158543 RepID=A0AAV7E1T0_ARIFI|nr:hypothetical protein H6P81_018412 [Aristolochia fimbriata]